MSIFLGGTGSTNELDDYEEGTFTPTHSANGGSAASGGTYSGQHGAYTKIGNRVHVACYLAWDGDWSGGSGSYAIDLPFTQDNSPATYAAINIGFAYHSGGALTQSNESIGGYVNGSKVLFYRIVTGQSTGAHSGNTISNTTWSNSNGYVQFNLTYKV